MLQYVNSYQYNQSIRFRRWEWTYNLKLSLEQCSKLQCIHMYLYDVIICETTLQPQLCKKLMWKMSQITASPTGWLQCKMNRILKNVKYFVFRKIKFHLTWKLAFFILVTRNAFFCKSETSTKMWKFFWDSPFNFPVFLFLFETFLDILAEYIGADHIF